MPGVARGLSDDVQHDFAQVLQPERTEKARPPGRPSGQVCAFDDCVDKVNLPPVQVEHFLGNNVRTYLPGVVVICLRPKWLTDHYIAEPEPFDVDGEMLHEP